MSGNKLLSSVLILVLMFQVVTIVSTPEVNGQVLTIKAQPVSTSDFAQEWKDFRLRYAMVYVLAFAVVL